MRAAAEDDRFVQQVDALQENGQIIHGSIAGTEVKLRELVNKPRNALSGVGVGQKFTAVVVVQTHTEPFVLVEAHDIPRVRQPRQGKLILSVRVGVQIVADVSVDKGRVGLQAEAAEGAGEEVHPVQFQALDIGARLVRGLLDDKFHQWIV